MGKIGKNVSVSKAVRALWRTDKLYYRSSQTFADNNLNQPADLIVPAYTDLNARIDWSVPGTPPTLSPAVLQGWRRTSLFA